MQIADSSVVDPKLFFNGSDFSMSFVSGSDFQKVLDPVSDPPSSSTKMILKSEIEMVKIIKLLLF
jgi:hypothetical protein